MEYNGAVEGVQRRSTPGSTGAVALAVPVPPQRLPHLLHPHPPFAPGPRLRDPLRERQGERERERMGERERERRRDTDTHTAR
eukprot:3819571-Rhodomonas_salina.1